MSAVSAAVLLETARLRLRRFTPADAPHVLELDGDPRVVGPTGTFIQAGGRVPDPEWSLVHTLGRFLAATGADGIFGYWLAEDRDSHAFCGWYRFTREGPGGPAEVELGYRMRAALWGRGLATEGARALVERAFAEPEVARVVATARADNPASRRVLEKAGLRLVGTVTGAGGLLRVCYARERWEPCPHYPSG